MHIPVTGITVELVATPSFPAIAVINSVTKYVLSIWDIWVDPHTVDVDACSSTFLFE